MKTNTVKDSFLICFQVTSAPYTVFIYIPISYLITRVLGPSIVPAGRKMPRWISTVWGKLDISHAETHTIPLGMSGEVVWRPTTIVAGIVTFLWLSKRRLDWFLPRKRSISIYRSSTGMVHRL